MIKFSADNDGYYTTIADMSAVIFTKTDEGYQVGPRYQFKNVTYYRGLPPDGKAFP